MSGDISKNVLISPQGFAGLDQNESLCNTQKDFNES